MNSCSTFGLINGGTAGLIWMYLICWVAFVFIYLSMAEMASMYVHWRPHPRLMSSIPTFYRGLTTR